MSPHETPPLPRRLPKAQRRAQLLAAARDLIREEGTDRLTLGRLAERAGVAKPLVYDHFGDRSGVLAELYREFDARQHAALDAALTQVEPDLDAVADLMAGAYLDCARAEGRELADVLSALTGSPTLERLRRDATDAYLAKCRSALAPVARTPVDTAGLHAVAGAADALSRASLAGELDEGRARRALARIIVAVAGG
ncbi:helix-turn-helix domain containing protein [Streptomyces sp. MS2A]|nr:helix-turn-helix domain containing protein [Streptomyces sp. MS2A]